MIVYHSAFKLKEANAHLLNGKKLKLLRSYARTAPKRPSYCSGVFLDSGAFSAFQSGLTLNVNEYIEHIKYHGDNYEAYAGLDVIGDPKATLANQLIMDNAGLHAIPTFHLGETFSVLEYYALKYPYIALGGMVRLTATAKLARWVDECWDTIYSLGANCKVHAFGLTDVVLCQRYPWYSVDSTSAARSGRSGQLMSPWGYLCVSSMVKDPSRHGAPIDSPKKIERVMGWVQGMFPDLDLTWDAISAATVQGEQQRIVVNALYIENELAKPIAPVKKRAGMFA